MDRQPVPVTLLVVVDAGCDFDVPKTARLVQSLESSHITSQQSLAVPAVTEAPGRSLNLKVGTLCRSIQEVLVASDVNQNQLVPWSRLNLVNDSQRIGVG